MEGGANDYDTTQDNFTYKSDFVFTPVQAWISTHTFRVGLDLGYQISDFERLEAGKIYYLAIISADMSKAQSKTNNSAKDITAASAGEKVCNGPDEFGAMSCGDDHYLPIVGYFRPARYKFDTFNYAVYGEDDINFDLGKGGDINTRLGVRLDGDNFLNKNKLAPRFSLQYVAPWSREWESSLTFGANRYYARNLTGYRLQGLNIATRRAAYRCGPNDPWKETTLDQRSNAGGNGGVFCGTNADKTNDATDPSVVINSGNVYNAPNFDGLDVPYDDELMGAISQNLGGAFNATLKYIHRDGKKQVMLEPEGYVASRDYLGDGDANYNTWGNSGWTKSHIITLAVKNIIPIKTASIEHFYMASVDFTNTKRNYITYNFDVDGATSLDGQNVAWEDVRQIYKEPLTFKLNTTHIYHYGKVNLSWNNLFTARGSYKRVIYAGESPTKNAHKTHKFNPSFNWDMRLGLDSGSLYINVDVLNVLDSKTVIPIGAENGVYLNASGVSTNAMILAYQLGRQFWVQMGYKF